MGPNLANRRTSMTTPHSSHFVIIGAGAAGLMAARELGRAGKAVTILEARGQCGGRIYPLPALQFGYPAEGGAEFVHGESPVTRALMGEARLSLSPIEGRRWSVRNGAFSQSESPAPHAARLYRALAELEADLPVAEFLEKHFAGRQYSDLRRAIKRMVEGYDAGDAARASTLAIRDEWMGRELGTQGRIVGGYGALIEFLAKECQRQGASIHLGAVVNAIEVSEGRAIVYCDDGGIYEGNAAIITMPLPLLKDIVLPRAAREKAAAGADIGFGNVVKILLRFTTKWWAHASGKDLADLSFLVSSARIPTWWTQHPAGHPVITGWFAGPKTDTVAHFTEHELVEKGLASLAEIFDLPLDRLATELVASRAINWANDPFARGAYSYATPKTREAQSILRRPDGAVFFSGEALYRGREMGTVEAALASGLETARTILTVAQ
jgi:monoamine oxidase